MTRMSRLALVASAVVLGGALVAAGPDAPSTFVPLDQGIDRATLERYHHTDQGTRLLPAAWLAALEKPDGSGKVMNADDLRRYGFMVDEGKTGLSNPYVWPLGWTVSDPSTSGGVAVAGFSCSIRHTDRIEYRCKAMTIEGGQAMIDLFPFVEKKLPLPSLPPRPIPRCVRRSSATPSRRATRPIAWGKTSMRQSGRPAFCNRRRPEPKSPYFRADRAGSTRCRASPTGCSART